MSVPKSGVATETRPRLNDKERAIIIKAIKAYTWEPNTPEKWEAQKLAERIAYPGYYRR